MTSSWLKPLARGATKRLGFFDWKGPGRRCRSCSMQSLSRQNPPLYSRFQFATRPNFGGLRETLHVKGYEFQRGSFPVILALISA